MQAAGTDSMPEDVERQGIGTPATRAATIEKLVQKGFLERKGNKKTRVLLPTDKGKALITVMPEEIQSPEMQEKFKDFQILHGREEKVNLKLTAYQVELAQVEAEIEKLLDTLTGANATSLAYANKKKKIEELDTRRQTISKAIAELSVETISPQQIKKLSYYLDNWDSIDFDDKRKAADGLISTIKATSDHVQIEWKI